MDLTKVVFVEVITTDNISILVDSDTKLVYEKGEPR